MTPSPADGFDLDLPDDPRRKRESRAALAVALVLHVVVIGLVLWRGPELCGPRRRRRACPSLIQAGGGGGGGGGGKQPTLVYILPPASKAPVPVPVTPVVPPPPVPPPPVPQERAENPSPAPRPTRSSASAGTGWPGGRPGRRRRHRGRHGRGTGTGHRGRDGTGHRWRRGRHDPATRVAGRGTSLRPDPQGTAGHDGDGDLLGPRRRTSRTGGDAAADRRCEVSRLSQRGHDDLPFPSGPRPIGRGRGRHQVNGHSLAQQVISPPGRSDA